MNMSMMCKHVHLCPCDVHVNMLYVNGVYMCVPMMYICSLCVHKPMMYIHVCMLYSVCSLCVYVCNGLMMFIDFFIIIGPDLVSQEVYILYSMCVCIITSIL